MGQFEFNALTIKNVTPATVTQGKIDNINILGNTPNHPSRASCRKSSHHQELGAGVEGQDMKKSAKVTYSVFNAADYLCNENVAAEYLSLAAQDDNPDVLLKALGEVAASRQWERQ